MQIISRPEARARGDVFYFTGKPCKHGHVGPRRVSTAKCVSCQVEEGKARYAANREGHLRRNRERYYAKREYYLAQQAEYRKANAEAKRAADASYRRRNRARIQKWRKDHYEANKDAILSSQKRYYEENKEELLKRQSQYNKTRRKKTKAYNRKYREENRQRINQYFRNKRAQDPSFRMRGAMYGMLSRCLKASGGAKRDKTYDLLGYTPAQLVDHIERQFKKGMSWSNYGEWHIDHITPLKWFFENGIDDPAAINCLTNLAPEWALDNCRKGGRKEKLL